MYHSSTITAPSPLAIADEADEVADDGVFAVDPAVVNPRPPLLPSAVSVVRAALAVAPAATLTTSVGANAFWLPSAAFISITTTR